MANLSSLLPDENYLFDLKIRTEGGEQVASSQMEIVPEMLGDRGALHAGLLVTLIDAATGRLAMRAAQPDVVATTHISFQTQRAIRGGTISAWGRTLRRGRSSVALDVELREGDEASAPKVGVGCATFSLIPRPPEFGESEFSSSDEPIVLERPGSGLEAPFRERIGLRTVDAADGVVELDLSPYLQNHLGALQGGIVGCLAEVSAELASRAASKAPLTVMDLSVQYLALGKTGPFRARSEVLRHSPDFAVSRVEIVDAGQGNRVLSVVTATAALIA